MSTSRRTAVAALDKRAMAQAFGAAAAHYEQRAVLQRAVADRAIERLDLMRITPLRILDLGAGTGYAARRLLRRYRRAQGVLLDIAAPMLQECRRRAPRWRSRHSFVCGDAENLPLRDRCVDLVFCNLALQWCNDLDPVFAEVRRVLTPTGLLMLTTLGPDTLKELRASWAAVNDSPHVHGFLDMHDVGDALVRSGLSSPVLDMEIITLTYSSVVELMRDLKAIGGHNVNVERARTLTPKGALRKLVQSYETLRHDGRLPATYEVIYGHAWGPTPGTRPQDGSTVARISAHSIGRRR